MLQTVWIAIHSNGYSYNPSKVKQFGTHAYTLLKKISKI